ncbi:MAG: class I SAM-dependent methyltransferase [Candidatus Accumulibacter sp.]|uniref:class I SAM-dependent methyltransferase n=1 Tax=Accumulibacter sp. TaxID=2053492 RepID=UPI0028782D68|nr:class I SAM-dependent methyltransferase [Accumulibacter sp.]MDS4016447.1 class I SAM-dependent methyltransferase [Accumulibacter sp.]
MSKSAAEPKPATPGDAPSDAPAPAAAGDPPAARPHLRQLALQAAAALAVLSLAWPYYGIRGEALPWPATACAIGGVAGLLAVLTRQAWWWWLIHLAFAPLAWSVARLGIDPGWFLLLFIGLLLVYRGALSGQVPLYLSNAQTAAVLDELTKDDAAVRFVDLGAGIGSVVRRLARRRPTGHFTGIENAPASWLIGRLRTQSLANCQWVWGNLWQTRLAAFDIVYAFLSPAPMAALWEKAQREMRPGSLLISNSFPIPGVAATSVVAVADHRQTQLYCYRLPGVSLVSGGKETSVTPAQ